MVLGMMISGLTAAGSAKPIVTKAPYGKTADGAAVEIYTLRNSAGSEARIITYGGTVVSLKVPDREGKFGEVVLGLGSLADYESQKFFLGSLIGRYANRIAKGKFTLGGKTYTLATNNGENHLHGGVRGFDRVVWRATGFVDHGRANLKLTYISKDGEEGYPGTLNVEVTYSLTEANELKVAYQAASDKDTICNLTQHSYFNLRGSGDILDHELMINADKFTPTDSGSIPTGELRSVKGTPFDFLTPTAIGKRISDDNEQLKFGNGYDHNWVLNKKGKELSLAAKLSDPVSGRVMEVWTTEPGLQFYSGNFLEGPFAHRSGLCLEAQVFPDSPNREDFPPAVLKKGGVYNQTTIYKFGTINGKK